jgi:hypothetical protein
VTFAINASPGRRRTGASRDRGKGRSRELRVADASLFSATPRAKTNICVIMIAEKVADAAVNSPSS